MQMKRKPEVGFGSVKVKRKHSKLPKTGNLPFLPQLRRGDMEGERAYGYWTLSDVVYLPVGSCQEFAFWQLLRIHFQREHGTDWMKGEHREGLCIFESSLGIVNIGAFSVNIGATHECLMSPTPRENAFFQGLKMSKFYNCVPFFVQMSHFNNFPTMYYIKWDQWKNKFVLRYGAYIRW